MATGDRYEGEWSDGKKNGNGINLIIQVYIYLLMEMSIKANFRMVTGKEMVFTPGATNLTMKDNGSATG